MARSGRGNGESVGSVTGRWKISGVNEEDVA